MHSISKLFLVTVLLIVPQIVRAANTDSQGAAPKLLSLTFNSYSTARNAYLTLKTPESKYELMAKEKALREKTKADMKKLKLLTRLPDLANQQGVQAEKVFLQESIDKAQKVLTISDGSNLFVTHDDYEHFFFKFSLGVQYDSVAAAFSKGHPRLGLLVYNRMFAPDIIDSDRGFGLYGIHTLLSALYTSSAEVATTSSNVSSDTQINMANKNAFVFDLPYFVPIFRTPCHVGSTLWEYSGPIVMVGGTKSDSSSGSTNNKVSFRKYAGLRTAFSPEHYMDVMYGRTDSLKSERLELRGQMPIYRTTDNTLMFMGITANVAIGNKQQDEADVVSTYISWNIDAKDIFTLFNPKNP